MTRDWWYVLDDAGEPVPVADAHEWEAFYAKGVDVRQVARDDVDGQDVSTVFLATNHAFGEGPPVLFETMIFGGVHDLYCERYCTRAEAVAGHDRVVAALRAGDAPDAES